MSNRKYVRLTLLFLVVLTLSSCTPKEVLKELPQSDSFSDVNKILNNFKSDFNKTKRSFENTTVDMLDSIIIDDRFVLNFYFKKHLLAEPIREETISYLTSILDSSLKTIKEKYIYNFIVENKPLQFYIPNFYRTDKSTLDSLRLPINASKRIPVIKYVDKKNNPIKGLLNRNIVLWNSHGWYYSQSAKRWEWQRPRLFQTVEDLLTTSFIIPYLLPMLEDAGATVFLPRERDIQTNEIILDDDELDNFKNGFIKISSLNQTHSWIKSPVGGFKLGKIPYTDNYNPFGGGAHHYIYSSQTESTSFEWIPEFPEHDEYSVYISFVPSPNNANDATYTITHLGGKTNVQVNQTIGGKTWTYVGSYKFSKGINPEIGRVTLSDKSSESDKIISADAVRFGGGMGIVSKNGSTSIRPKFVEGALYYLQFAGAPDSLVYNLNSNNSYTDDYQSRAEFANYLNGAPLGPNKNREHEGLKIPIDLTLAFHTDAGVTTGDSTIGTLVIYSSIDLDSSNYFPNGLSRYSNRDFADILQTEIVQDIKFHFDPNWTKRDLRNSLYSEAYRPNMTGVLLELLSHQNFFDMQFAHDPRFKIAASRAIYKSMLKYLSVVNNSEYIVSPLPVTHFRTDITTTGNVRLDWKEAPDPLEPSAIPTGYIVYTRLCDGGFDNGTFTSSPFIEFSNLTKDTIYSFKVTAVNDGGKSMPSEILSTNISSNNPIPFLIINGFDRICGPHAVKDSAFAGFMNIIDAGVPHNYDLSFTGLQYDFSPTSEFISNDMPGHGASHSDFESKIIAGNTFDFVSVHGTALKNLGYSFVSSSDEAIEDNFYDLTKYKFVDLILGEEKSTKWIRPEFDSLKGIQFKTFTNKMQSVLKHYLYNGGNLFVSGAHIASDIILSSKDTNEINFLRNILKYDLASPSASRTGQVESITKGWLPVQLKFNNELNNKIYQVESPDGLIPVNGSETIYRYSENFLDAAIFYKKEYGVAAFGFPFETIIDETQRLVLMNTILELFELK
ncbi:MAG: fibronectin type III domain-containing protein [Ignavibacteria bacterium]|nr:fibronectin type III domain-containing protein [Ignavibacteria bacterium]